MNYKVIVAARGVDRAPKVEAFLKEMGIEYWQGNSVEFHTDYVAFADANALKDLLWYVDGVDTVKLFPDYGVGRDTLHMKRMA